MRAAILIGVLLHYAIAGVLLAYGAPLERLDAPMDTSLAMIELSGPPPSTALRDSPYTNISPPYREHAQEVVGCSVPNPWSRRIAGEACVHPSEDDRRAMVRDGVEHTIGVFEVCASTAGTVASVKQRRTTKYEGYDRRLMAALRDWRFVPYLVDGRPRAICTAVTFLYTIK